MSTDEGRAAEFAARREAAAELGPAKAQAAAGLADLFAAGETPVAPALPQFTQPAAATTEPVVEQPQTATTEVVETVPQDTDVPQYTYIEIDDEEDDEEDFAVEVESPDTDDEFSEFEDVDALRARLAQVQKEANFHREQSLKARQGQWRKRYAEKYPLADFDTIQSTSRRSFEKAAVKSHNDNYTKLKPHIDRLQEAATELRATGVAEGREAAVAAWGAPVAGPDVQTVDQAAADAQIAVEREKARTSGNLGGLYRKMIELGR